MQQPEYRNDEDDKEGVKEQPLYQMCRIRLQLGLLKASADQPLDPPAGNDADNQYDKDQNDLADGNDRAVTERDEWLIPDCQNAIPHE